MTTSASDRHDTTLLVANPAAGSGGAARVVDSVAAGLRDFGLSVKLELTRHPGHAAEIVRRWVDGGGRHIVVAGGDGTIGEAVSGMVDADGPRAQNLILGIVHAGTGGDFCRALELPRDLPDAVATAACGRPVAMDVGFAEFEGSDGPASRSFLNAASVGLSGNVVEMAEGGVRRAGPTAAFALASLGSLMRLRPFDLRIDTGGGWATASLTDLMICNGRYVGGGMLAAPLARPDDGRFDVLLIGAAPRLRLAMKMPKIYRGTHLDDPAVRYERTDTVRVEAAQPAPVVLDGELVGTTPLRARLFEHAIRVRIPD